MSVLSRSWPRTMSRSVRMPTGLRAGPRGRGREWRQAAHPRAAWRARLRGARELERHAPDLLVIGKREPSAPNVQHGAMGGVGFRIAYHAPVDVLVLPS